MEAVRISVVTLVRVSFRRVLAACLKKGRIKAGEGARGSLGGGGSRGYGRLRWWRLGVWTKWKVLVVVRGWGVMRECRGGVGGEDARRLVIEAVWGGGGVWV